MSKIIICANCKLEKDYHAKGLCKKCYKLQYSSPTIVCVGCGKEKKHFAHSLCRQCYDVKYYHENKEKIKIKITKYLSKEGVKEKRKKHAKEYYYKPAVHVSQEQVKRYIQEQEGKSVFEYDVFNCPKELKGQSKIGDFSN